MEPLSDPLKDRVVKDVRPPPHKPLSDALLYPCNNKVPDWKQLKTHLAREGKLTKEQVLKMIRRVHAITRAEPNLIKIADPVTVVGDIHGQYYDLCRLLEVGGDPDKTQYAFLGDYVDRGSFSIECLLLICALKLNYPKRIWMLRGNHECRQMTTFFNFRDECEHKYDLTIYNAFMEFFDSLPLAVLINKKFFGVHGGLSPDLTTLSQLNTVQRFKEPPRSGLFCDLLWADPVDEEKTDLVARAKIEKFVPNEVRGCSYFFGYDAASNFLERDQLLSIIRAHEAQLDGYKMHAINRQNEFPTVITIFSAPNYCDCYNNKGAVLKFENNTLNIQQFNFSQHPYHLPNFMDVFQWSVPFVSEKITEMIHSILSAADDANITDEEIDAIQLPEEVALEIQKVTGKPLSSHSIAPPSSATKPAVTPTAVVQQQPAVQQVAATPSSSSLPSRAEALRKKVQTVSRIMRMFKTLRQENELVVKLKGVSPGHRIPMGVLLQGKEGMVSELDRFTKLKNADAVNEAMPTEMAVEERKSSSSTASGRKSVSAIAQLQGGAPL